MHAINISLMLLFTFQIFACSDRWNLKVVHGRYSEVDRYKVEGLPYADANHVMLLNFKKSLGINESEIIQDFESQASLYDIELSYVDARRVLGSYVRPVVVRYGLSLHVLANESAQNRILEREIDGISWKYSLDKSWKYPLNFNDRDAVTLVYVDEKMLVIKEGIEHQALYTIVDMKTGKHKDSSPPVSVISHEGFSARSKYLYIALGSTSRDQDSYLVKYELENKSIVPISVIPNDFSNGKMTIGIQPMFSFLDDKYVLVKITPKGRGINFSGFVVVDVESGEFVLHDIDIGWSGSFSYYATENGDFVYSKRLSEDSIIRHVKFK